MTQIMMSQVLPLGTALNLTASQHRGPFVGDRIIDLSKASADALGISGLGQVRVQYAGPADPMASNRAPVRPPVEVARPVLDDYAQAPAPTPAPVVPYTAPTPAPTPAPYVAPAPVAPTAPEAVGDANEAPDGQITLTIKGPIHIAKHDGANDFLIRERLEVK